MPKGSIAKVNQLKTAMLLTAVVPGRPLSGPRRPAVANVPATRRRAALDPLRN